MSTFKVGDKVRRIGSNCAGTVTGGIYTVKGIRLHYTIMLLEFPADKLGWSTREFELASQVNKFKVGDTVRCIDSYGCHITHGEVYTVKEVVGEYLRVIDDGGRLGGYRYTRFELAQEPVLTPEEVFKHLRDGTELQVRRAPTHPTWTDVKVPLHSTLEVILKADWRIKPVPKIIEANGRKYKLITE